jgi:Tfp pilus assembly protein PilF
MSSLADQYYIKAKDQYPYDLEVSTENLNYALSYDDEHYGANHLMAKLFHEQLGDAEQAEEYYKRAIGTNPFNDLAYYDYAMLLITKREYKKAKEVLKFVKKLKTVDLGRCYHLIALKYEYQKKYDLALKNYKKALLESYNEDVTSFLNNEIKRVKEKKKMIKNSLTENTEKKKNETSN